MAKATTANPNNICPVTAGLVDLAAYAAVDGNWRALKLSAPARRALINAGYTELPQLAGVSHRHIAALHGMGPKALRMLADALAAAGMQFGD